MAKIKYKSMSNFYVGMYKIIPGINEVKDDDFRVLEKSKSFLNRVEKGIIEILIPPEPKKEVEKPVEGINFTAPSQMGTRALLRMVEESLSEEFLSWVAEEDKREKVKKAALDRLKVIKE